MHSSHASFGYSFFEEQYRTENNIDLANVARIISDSRERYILQTAAGVCNATITGKLRHGASLRTDLPAIGDWVNMSMADQENATIHSVFPRRTVLQRSAVGRNDVQIIAANIDTAFIVAAADRDFNLNRIDRYLTLILDGGIIPVLLLNKCDLVSEDSWRNMESSLFKRHPAVEFIATSIVTGQGLEFLAASMKKGQTCCFIGSSGVGKSSLINHIAGHEVADISDIGLKSNRGRHTTTRRELHQLPEGALLIDTPGMREVAMSDAGVGVQEAFPQIEELATRCHFKDCGHQDEPGCAVAAAIESGDLDAAMLNSFHKLKRESQRFEEKIADRRRRDKAFGKMAREVFKLKKQSKGY